MKHGRVVACLNATISPIDYLEMLEQQCDGHERKLRIVFSKVIKITHPFSLSMFCLAEERATTDIPVIVVT